MGLERKNSLITMENNQFSFSLKHYLQKNIYILHKKKTIFKK